MKKNKVLVPCLLDCEFKEALMNHCKNEGMTLSGLIRKLLKLYATKKGILK